MTERTKLKAYEEETRIISEDGQEKRIIRKSLRRVSEEPPYIKLYLDMLLCLRQINISGTGLLAELLSRISYATQGQHIDIGRALRKEICAKLRIPESTYYRQVKDFINAGILGANVDERGRYDMSRLYVNPHIFGRGDWNSVQELRIHVKLNESIAAILTEVKPEAKPIADDPIFKSAWTWDTKAIEARQLRLIDDDDPAQGERAESATRYALKSAMKPPKRQKEPSE